ncbi:MAG: hypothetical protein ACK5WZ_00750, partial [Pseudobdellovibrionaceae bacterium]
GYTYQCINDLGISTVSELFSNLFLFYWKLCLPVFLFRDPSLDVSIDHLLCAAGPIISIFLLSNL